MTVKASRWKRFPGILLTMVVLSFQRALAYVLDKLPPTTAGALPFSRTPMFAFFNKKSLEIFVKLTATFQSVKRNSGYPKIFYITILQSGSMR